MRRPLLLFVIATTVCATAVAGSAAPAKPARKALPVVLHLHGQNQFDDGPRGSGFVREYNQMDAKQGSAAKSAFIFNGVLVPDTTCSGSVWLPVWVGSVAGTVPTDVTVTLNVLAGSGGQVYIQLWKDLDEMACPPNNLPPKRQATITLPTSGPVTAKLSGDTFTARHSMMLQVTPVDDIAPGVLKSPFVSRLSYDGTGADDATVAFGCIPLAGAKSC
jgi:hypothetical protein